MGWKSIDTAPKRSKWILVAVELNNKKWEMAVAHYRSGNWYYSDKDVFGGPTHWMPLPDAPVTK